jgi:V/A-type H+-transporting ATPase subunit B
MPRPWRLRGLAAIIGAEELSDADRRYLEFAENFERRFIGQGEDEDRSVYETLNLAWDLLSMLPPEALIRVSEEELAKYHKWQAVAEAA